MPTITRQQIRQTGRRCRALKALPAWGTKDAPPLEFLIFALGANEATLWSGERVTAHLTAAGAKRIAAEWKRRGVRLAADYEHSVLSPATGEPKPAAAFFELAARPDGLWAVRVEWSDRARALLSGGEYKHFSPYFKTASVKGREEIVALYNIGLTNWPATDNQRPLVASAAASWSKSMPSPEQIAAALAEKYNLDAEQLAADLAALMADDPEESMAAGEGTEQPAPPQGEAASAEARGAAVALTAAQEEARALSARVAELEGKVRRTEVDDAIRKGLFTPSQRDELLGLTPDAWSSAQRYARPVVTTKAAQPPAARSSAGTEDEPTVKSVLTDEMRAWCTKMGTDPEKFALSWIRHNGKTPWKAS